MNKVTDIIVVGSGLAGLMAAVTACRSGASVKLITDGMGSIAISGGLIDLLGYSRSGDRLEDPWSGIDRLPAEHPYSIVGKKNIQKAIDLFQDIVASRDWPMKPAAANANTLMPTILGTLKPTYLLPAGFDPACMQTARSVLVASVQGLRDCRPGLVINQLRRYEGWADKNYGSLVLPLPFQDGGRSINALDIARHVEKKDGLEWLVGSIDKHAVKYDLVLIPPICGRHADATLWQSLVRRLERPVVEMLSIPPGVGGLRIRDALLQELCHCNFEFVENARIIRAEMSGNKCSALIARGSGREYRHKAGFFIMATGGILGSGITLQAGKAYESIFGIDLLMPENVDDWSSPDLFGKHMFATLGVTTDDLLRPLDAHGNLFSDNVYFCGRTLGGYDFAVEKSGHGVALATGVQAARNALS